MQIQKENINMQDETKVTTYLKYELQYLNF